MEQIHINFPQFNSLIQIADYFRSEDVCKQAIAQERWGGEAVCPYCGCTHTYMTAEGRYIWKGCASHFSITVDTIFENTQIATLLPIVADSLSLLPHLYSVPSTATNAHSVWPWRRCSYPMWSVSPHQ